MAVTDPIRSQLGNVDRVTEMTECQADLKFTILLPQPPTPVPVRGVETIFTFGCQIKVMAIS